MTRAAIFYGASALGCAEAPSVAPDESVVGRPMEPAPREVLEASAIEPETPELPLPAPSIEPDTEEEAREERADAEDRKRRRGGLFLRRRPPPCCPPYGAPPFDFIV